MTPEHLRSFRHSLGLSQAEFARMLGVANGRTVRRWEAGEISIPGPVAVIWALYGLNPPLVGKWLKGRAVTG